MISKSIPHPPLSLLKGEGHIPTFALSFGLLALSFALWPVNCRATAPVASARPAGGAPAYNNRRRRLRLLRLTSSSLVTGRRPAVARYSV